MTTREKILALPLTDAQLAFFYLGQEGYLLKFRDTYILIDGYLTDFLDRTPGKDPRLFRRFPSPLTPAECDFVDFVFCSHNHGDHTDIATIESIAAVNDHAAFCIPAAFADEVAAMGAKNVCPLATDAPVRLTDSITVTAIPAAHEELHPTDGGNYAENGFVFDFDGIRVYHAGDSCIYDGLEERVSGADVVMLPVNGRDYYRRHRNCIGNMDALEAITLAHRVGASLCIPMHYDLFPHNRVCPANFVNTAELYREEYGALTPYHLFQPGEGYIFTPGL